MLVTVVCFMTAAIKDIVNWAIFPVIKIDGNGVCSIVLTGKCVLSVVCRTDIQLIG